MIHQSFSGICPVCGCKEFAGSSVLWPELIDSWQLTNEEVDYINRQQGFHCKECNNNMRSMGLASAILREYNCTDTLEQFITPSNTLKILEINTAGNLTSFLKIAPNHKLVEYPQFDMMNLNIESTTYDLVIHSDTLEHVSIPERGLAECLRVLRPKGKCIFTVPIIVDRMTRGRDGLLPSYHGQSGVPAEDQLVYSEFGADAWKVVLKAGFISCEILAFEYPSALVIIGHK